MSNKEVEFNQQMVDLLCELTPSDQMLSNINPWSKPVGFITMGFILTTLRLNVFNLQLILPTIGAVLIFLGFRSLRNENIYFRTAWMISILKLILQSMEIMRISSPLNTLEYPVFMLGVFAMGLQITMYLMYHLALKMTYEKAGKSMEDKPLVGASIWTIAAFLLALSPLSESWLVAVPMVIFYVLIIRSLTSVGGQLDDTGYFLINAPVRIRNRTFGWGYILIMLMVAVVFSINFNHLKLESIEYHLPDITEERKHLLDMEFPSEALMQVSDEEVISMSEAIDVKTFSKTLMIDPKRIEQVDSSEGYTQITHTYEPGKSNIELKTIYVEMPDNEMIVMQYFVWKEGRPVWQDGITIIGETEVADKEIIGSGLFYNRKGIGYTAQFPRVVCGEVDVDTMFGVHRSELISGAMSYPFGSEAQGGYVLYRYKVLADSAVFTTHAIFSYAHQGNPTRIPYERTEDRIVRGAIVFEDELQQHVTHYESFKSRNRNR